MLLALVAFMASCGSGAAALEDNANDLPLQTDAQTPVKSGSVSSQEAKALLAQQKDIVILDIRTPGEWASGYLQGAQLMNFYDADFSERLQAMDPAKPYLVYCAVGGRSKEALAIMNKLGFKRVYEAKEGFNALKKAGIPVE